MRAAIATKEIEIVAVNDPFLSMDYMVSFGDIFTGTFTFSVGLPLQV